MSEGSPTAKGGKHTKIIVLLVFIGLIVAAYATGLTKYFEFQYIKSQQAQLQAYYESNPAALISGYVAVYIISTALSLPGGALLTLLGGALFGLAMGTLVVSFASTIGATLAFLVARFVLGSSVQEKFGDKLKKINEGVEKDGAFYLFTMRLVPAFPFFVVNLVMGLTKIPIGKYYIVSQIGMLPGTLVYVNAGKELSKIDSAAGILSPSLLISFAVLGVFPIVAKKGLEFFKNKKEATSS